MVPSYCLSFTYCKKFATVFGALSGYSSTTKLPALVLNWTLGSLAARAGANIWLASRPAATAAIRARRATGNPEKFIQSLLQGFLPAPAFCDVGTDAAAPAGTAVAAVSVLEGFGNMRRISASLGSTLACVAASSCTALS